MRIELDKIIVLTSLLDSERSTEVISSVMSLDRLDGISMAFEVNESIVSFHYHTCDSATILKNLLKIFLLSTAGDTRNIDLREFSIAFARW